MNYFILIVSDSLDELGCVVDAWDVASKRLKAHIWPLYPNTRNRKLISPGDQCLVYLAGKGQSSQRVIAKAKIVVASSPNGRHQADQGLFGIGLPVSVIRLEEVVYFSNPVHFPTLLTKLSLTKNCAHKKWGVYLQGGCRRISKDDFNLIDSLSRMRA